MGRDVYTIIKRGDETVWESFKDIREFYCGRNEATNVLAYRVENWNDATVDFSTKESYESIYDELNDVHLRYLKNVEDLNETIEDLRKCRQRASTLESFDDFTQAIRDVKEQLEDEPDRATWLMNLMQRTVIEARKMNLVTDDTSPLESEMNIGEYKVLWVVSE